jgi:hypothetical protein
MENKYIIFAGCFYEQFGGWDDLYDITDTLESALEIYHEALTTGTKYASKINEMYKDDFPDTTEISTTYPCHWAHIVCLTTNKIIKNSRD